MAVANTKSSTITRLDSTPRKAANLNLDGARIRARAATLEVAAADDDNSVYRFCRVHSRDRIRSIMLFNDAITNGTAYDVGLHDTLENGAAVVSQQLFGSAVDLSSARVAPLDVRYEAGDIVNMEKAVWELLALSADPNKEYDLTMVGTTVGTAAGTISVEMTYVDGT